MATKTRRKAGHHRAADDFKLGMTALACILGAASELAKELLARHPKDVDFYSHHTDLTAVWAGADVLEDMLNSAGASDYDRYQRVPAGERMRRLRELAEGFGADTAAPGVRS